MTNYSKPGEYASLEEMTSKRSAYQTGSISLSHTLRALLLEQTDLKPDKANVIGKTVTFHPGSAIMTTVLDIDGIEYEVYVRQAP